MTYYS